MTRIPNGRATLLAGPLLAIALLSGCAQPTGASVALTPDTPGSTGRTIVPGNNSSVAGDAAATEMQQKWPIGRDR